MLRPAVQLIKRFSVFRNIAVLRAVGKLRLYGVAVQHHHDLVHQASRLKRLQRPPDRPARLIVCLPPGTRLFREWADPTEHVARPDLTASLGPVQSCPDASPPYINVHRLVVNPRPMTSADRPDTAPSLHVVDLVQRQQQPRRHIARVLQRLQGLREPADTAHQVVAEPDPIFRRFFKVRQNMQHLGPLVWPVRQQFTSGLKPAFTVKQNRPQVGFFIDPLIDHRVIPAATTVGYLLQHLLHRLGPDGLQPLQRPIDRPALGLVDSGVAVYCADAGRGVAPAFIREPCQRQVGADLIGRGLVVQQGIQRRPGDAERSRPAWWLAVRCLGVFHVFPLAVLALWC